jgi:hypothetical protein
MTSTNNDLRLNLLLKDFPLHTLGKVLAICTLLKYIDSWKIDGKRLESSKYWKVLYFSYNISQNTFHSTIFNLNKTVTSSLFYWKFEYYASGRESDFIAKSFA